MKSSFHDSPSFQNFLVIAVSAIAVLMLRRFVRGSVFPTPLKHRVEHLFDHLVTTERAPWVSAVPFSPTSLG